MSFGIPLKFKRVGSYAYEPPLPVYQTKGSSGMDVHAAESVSLDPGEWKAIGTGWSVEIPIGYELQIRARSGLALKRGVTVLNGIGSIDADYRGEIKVILINHSKDSVIFSSGDRIAQLILASVDRAFPAQVEALSETSRGEGGFGHTGV